MKMGVAGSLRIISRARSVKKILEDEQSRFVLAQSFIRSEIAGFKPRSYLAQEAVDLCRASLLSVSLIKRRFRFARSSRCSVFFIFSDNMGYQLHCGTQQGKLSSTVVQSVSDSKQAVDNELKRVCEEFTGACVEPFCDER
ncbi:hypothetical protein BJ742DRAFT_744783 [Cladochytrium replicatum]|nr:hypothetical protein BJ742DRAFT_744783 [Cladochytrium replicatum]